MKAWLKGGLIALGVFIIYSIIVGLTNWLLGGVTSFATSTEKIALLPHYLLPDYSGLNDATGLLVGLFKIYILSPLFWVVIGALIGLGFDRRKKKKLESLSETKNQF